MRCLVAVLVAGLLGACAGPPLVLYTLRAPMAEPATLPAMTRIVAVTRVVVPDALDSQDILVRQGAILRRSATGRWATRLSLGVTDLITARLAARYPHALVTDQPQAGAVTARLNIDISALDLGADGTAVLTANWTVIPTDPARPMIRDRARIVQPGSVADDAAVVALIGQVVGVLANRIALPPS
jgi:uncharacterized lipoprotein YmbA